MRRHTGLLVALLLGAGCSNPTTASPPITNTTPETTATTRPATSDAVLPETRRQAHDLLLGELADLTPGQVRAAGLLVGGHRAGLPFPRLYLTGDGEMRQAVIDVLGQPTPWNAQILVGLTDHYEPSAPELAGLRDRVLTDVFGEQASIAHELMTSAIALLQSPDQAGPWYDIPAVVSRVEGELTEFTFEGSAMLASDTGEASGYTVRARHTDLGWRVVDGTWLHLGGWEPEYAEIDRGPALGLSDLDSLPQEVIAVTAAGDIVIVDTDGSVLGHLPFFTWQHRRGGPGVVLEDAAGTPRGLDGEAVDGYPLAGGAHVVSVPSGGVQRWSIVSPGGARTEFSGDWRVDATGTIVTPSYYHGGTALDVTTGTTVEIPTECWVADASRSDWVLACRRGGRSPTIETLAGAVLVDDEEWGDLYGASGWPWPLPDDQHVVGHWEALLPHGERWLGKWSGECESEDGLLVTADSVIPLGGADWEQAPSASVGGWTGDGRAVFSLHGDSAACGTASNAAGVYIAAPGEEGRLIWDSGGRTVGVAVWHLP